MYKLSRTQVVAHVLSKLPDAIELISVHDQTTDVIVLHRVRMVE